MRRDFSEVIKLLKLHLQKKYGFKQLSNVKEVFLVDKLGCNIESWKKWKTKGVVEKAATDVILDFCFNEGLNPSHILFKR